MFQAWKAKHGVKNGQQALAHYYSISLKIVPIPSPWLNIREYMNMQISFISAGNKVSPPSLRTPCLSVWVHWRLPVSTSPGTADITIFFCPLVLILTQLNSATILFSRKTLNNPLILTGNDTPVGIVVLAHKAMSCLQKQWSWSRLTPGCETPVHFRNSSI